MRNDFASSDAIPKVCIGLPVYNGEKYIRDALESILAQSFSDFELIISDNNSNDKTEQICREFSKNDARVTYIRQQNNYGPGANFLFVLEQARSPHFMWVAADDVWGECWLDSLYSAITEEDVVVYGIAAFADGDLASRTVCPDSFRKNSFIKYFLNRNHKAMYIYGLFNRSKLDKLDRRLFDSDCTSADHLLLMSLLRYGGLRAGIEETHVYRIHNDQVSKSNTSKRNKLFYALNFHQACYYHNSIKMTPGWQKIIIILLVPVHYMVGLFLALKHVMSRSWFRFN